MSVARAQFLENIAGLKEALALEAVAGGATGAVASPGVLVLRRGVLVASLVALETFVRERTSEALLQLGRWPAKFEDLPQKLRDASHLNALNHLHRYATMLRRQDEDYEVDLFAELKKMASVSGGTQQFTKFVAGDYTGNLSDNSLKELLSSLQIKDCWNTFRIFSSDIGFGIPSVHEVLKDIVRKRHRSAHSAGYAPTAADITDLAANLFCVAVCFDISITSSIEQALVQWKEWADGKCSWRDGVDLYFFIPEKRSNRLVKYGRNKAISLVQSPEEAKIKIPRAAAGRTAILVERDLAGKPVNWIIL